MQDNVIPMLIFQLTYVSTLQNKVITVVSVYNSHGLRPNSAFTRVVKRATLVPKQVKANKYNHKINLKTRVPGVPSEKSPKKWYS